MIEVREKRPEWLRPEAIPAMLQLLTHENAAVRGLLVDLLAEIPGKRSTEALAHRAVFDLDADNRLAAIDALRSRPAEEFRAIFLKALRYPWAPAADHAAEALVALRDRGAVLELVTLLREPDPTSPRPVSNDRAVVQEVVRANHSASCMLCHPPSKSGDEPVLAIDPVRPNPPVCQAASKRQRFDYVVRTRLATKAELNQSHAEDAVSYPQREAVLFALRELSGKDVGETTMAWEDLFPSAREDVEAARLSRGVLDANPIQQQVLLQHLRDDKGLANTLALARVIPSLKGSTREQARQFLVARLARMSSKTLRDKLSDGDTEIRQAAVQACVRNAKRELVPDLIALLDSNEPVTSRVAEAALQELTGRDFDGPGAWRAWWRSEGRVDVSRVD